MTKFLALIAATLLAFAAQAGDNKDKTHDSSMKSSATFDNKKKATRCGLPFHLVLARWKRNLTRFQFERPFVPALTTTHRQYDRRHGAGLGARLERVPAGGLAVGTLQRKREGY